MAVQRALARDREAPDDALRSLGHEHGHIRVALDATDVAPLVAAPPGIGQPEFGLACDFAPERNERVRVTGDRGPDQEPVAQSETTMPCPPRRGSPAAARLPASSFSTADAPPK